MPAPTNPDNIVSPTNEWYHRHARDLPWRAPGCPSWHIMISEFMLQQTPVNRVLPVWQEWVTRWNTPADLAAEPPAAALRAWGRLGYPRRAARLHAAAVAIVNDHGGNVPTDEATLRTLPGVGEYTAAAITSFAHGQRTVVVDTNVRRVLARAVGGQQFPPTSYSAVERALAHAIAAELDDHALNTWNAAAMELGAVICTARVANCEACPLAAQCRWRAAGHPESTITRKPSQKYAGTDRFVRGLIMGAARVADEPLDAATVENLWHDAAQRDRALASLIADGLITGDATCGYQLPQTLTSQPL